MWLLPRTSSARTLTGFYAGLLRSGSMNPINRPPADPRWQARRPGERVRRSGPYLGPVRLTPTRVTLGIALGGSALFILYGVIVRDPAQIPLLSAGFAVFGIVFTTLALAGAIETYRVARDGQGARAFGLALLGGVAALIAAGSFAIAAVLALVWRG